MSGPSPQELLAQARHLATKDPGIPAQASLRRAVSTSYYALFHLLSGDGSALLAGGDAKLQRLIGRAFVHSDMVQACRTFATPGERPALIGALYVPLVEPPELQRVAQAFLDLQSARHDADYSTHRAWSRIEALSEVERAEEAFGDWSSIRPGAVPPAGRVMTADEREGVRLFLVWLVMRKVIQSR
jgi:uncharacterized protein (UPF0332 family)